jgi:hypothetical protein
MNKIALAGIISGSLVLLAALCLGIFLLWVNAGEYRPDDRETVEVSGNPPVRPVFNHPLELYSWNIGYASLDASQDFFLAGGRGVRPPADSNVEANIWAIQAFLSGNAPDSVFLQEVDRGSNRSYGVDEAGYFSGTWKGSSAYAVNYRCVFVPFPLFRFTGRVESGLLTLNSYGAAAERVALPEPFGWPERLFRLKHCLLVERVPLQDSEAQLVLVNVYLDGVSLTARLAAFCRAEYERGNYVVAGGTFNQNFPGLEAAFPPRAGRAAPPPLDRALFGEEWTFAADPSVPSSRLLDRPYEKGATDNQFFLMDGFILSPNVTLISAETVDLDFRNSDHNPVKLAFSLNAPQEGP